MTEYLNDDQIAQRIIDSRSDLQRYLNLAPSIKTPSREPKAAYSSEALIPLFPISRPTLRP